jgi:hypothetical protein
MSPSPEPWGITVHHGAGGSLVYVIYSGSSKRYVRGFDTNGTLRYSWSVDSIGVEAVAADDDNDVIYVADKTNSLIKVFRLDGTFVLGDRTEFVIGDRFESCGEAKREWSTTSKCSLTSGADT